MIWDPLDLEHIVVFNFLWKDAIEDTIVKWNAICL
jgi:hypothetical protein